MIQKKYITTNKSLEKKKEQQQYSSILPPLKEKFASLESTPMHKNLINKNQSGVLSQQNSSQRSTDNLYNKALFSSHTTKSILGQSVKFNNDSLNNIPISQYSIKFIKKFSSSPNLKSDQQKRQDTIRKLIEKKHYTREILAAKLSNQIKFQIQKDIFFNNLDYKNSFLNGNNNFKKFTINDKSISKLQLDQQKDEKNPTIFQNVFNQESQPLQKDNNDKQGLLNQFYILNTNDKANHQQKPKNLLKIKHISSFSMQNYPHSHSEVSIQTNQSFNGAQDQISQQQVQSSQQQLGKPKTRPLISEPSQKVISSKHLSQVSIQNPPSKKQIQDLNTSNCSCENHIDKTNGDEQEEVFFERDSLHKKTFTATQHELSKRLSSNSFGNNIKQNNQEQNKPQQILNKRESSSLFVNFDVEFNKKNEIIPDLNIQDIQNQAIKDLQDMCVNQIQAPNSPQRRTQYSNNKKHLTIKVNNQQDMELQKQITRKLSVIAPELLAQSALNSQLQKVPGDFAHAVRKSVIVTRFSMPTKIENGVAKLKEMHAQKLQPHLNQIPEIITLMRQEVVQNEFYNKLIEYFCDGSLDQFFFYCSKFIHFIFSRDKSLLSTLNFFKINEFLQQQILQSLTNSLQNIQSQPEFTYVDIEIIKSLFMEDSKVILPSNLLEELGGHKQVTQLIKKLIEQLRKTPLYDKIILINDMDLMINEIQKFFDDLMRDRNDDLLQTIKQLHNQFKITESDLFYLKITMWQILTELGLIKEEIKYVIIEKIEKQRYLFTQNDSVLVKMEDKVLQSNLVNNFRRMDQFFKRENAEALTSLTLNFAFSNLSTQTYASALLKYSTAKFDDTLIAQFYQSFIVCIKDYNSYPQCLKKELEHKFYKLRVVLGTQENYSHYFKKTDEFMKELNKWFIKYLEEKQGYLGLSFDSIFHTKVLEWFLNFYLNDYDIFSFYEMPIAAKTLSPCKLELYKFWFKGTCSLSKVKAKKIKDHLFSCFKEQFVLH